ncbi:hypothetical protein ABEF92_003114 [Exophiala dermatitidis]|uniref:Uncharacterized protein n=1 Tax=Exophiala dermatitidis (strain ATCC 34100 / CBS 525.76 / NIH/UT8656) TaxID=858893 RepID=H6BN26_EXODN|nr:uncharacterized protein HMPREF1120_00367 [Exophiala dermatitidis NIH/UT8656]EHY52150.1 hypothetical protein HMPREF1120_00367 [Exophiala dermatitidis NIH/UT8656]
MAGLTPLPTHRIHSTTRLTHQEAHTFLSSFLERADIDAAYRPDSTLTERGPQAVSTGSGPNLTLHHLKRILVGIEGKRIGGAILTEGGDDNNQETTTSGKGTKREHQEEEESADKKQSKRKIYNAADDDATNVIADDSDGPAIAVQPDDGEAGWQDKNTFALAQTEDNLEATADDRHPGADLEQPTNEAEEEELTYVEQSMNQKGSKDKEERKRLKKLRQKQEKASKAEQARKKSSKT